jgi:hypothetical protein
MHGRRFVLPLKLALKQSAATIVSPEEQQSQSFGCAQQELKSMKALRLSSGQKVVRWDANSRDISVWRGARRDGAISRLL